MAAAVLGVVRLCGRGLERAQRHVETRQFTLAVRERGHGLQAVAVAQFHRNLPRAQVLVQAGDGKAMAGMQARHGPVLALTASQIALDLG